MAFRPEAIECFRITSFEVDPLTASAILRYSLDDEYQFEERVDFGRPRERLSTGRAKGFEGVVRLLHLVAGVSYYKTAAPMRISVETGSLTDAERRLLHDVYDRGMREFAYRNALAVPRNVEISASCTEPAHEHNRNQSHSESQTRRERQEDRDAVEAPERGIGIPVGGGKDSIVVIEALEDLAESRPLLVSVNPNPAVERIASISGLDLARVGRKIDPRLFDLNRNGALNGHVPVTAIISLLTVAGGYIHGYDTTAIALESSADAPTRVLGATGASSTEVNHQWSKSAEFETQLQAVLRESVHDAIRFLSPLRAFTELEIAAAFATATPYLTAFRSCNRAFRILDAFDGWCLECPKCRFVFLALATAMGRKEVVALFGADLLDDEAQVEGFFDLVDATRKPFECVGTVDEVTQALLQLLADPSWSGAVVLEHMRPVIEDTLAASDDTLTESGDAPHRSGERLPDSGDRAAGDAHRRATSEEVFAGVRRALAKGT